MTAASHHGYGRKVPLHHTHMTTRFELMSRRPRRVTITVPDMTHRHLLALSDEQGRSMSNLASYLLEQALHERFKAQQNEALR